jgi:amidase
VLADLGHQVEDVPAPDGDLVVAAFERVWAVAAAAAPVDDESKLRPLTRWLRAQGRQVAGPEFAEAIGALQLATRRLAADFARYDAVLTPTLAQPAAKVGALRDDNDPPRDFENQKRFTPFTSVANMSGQPSISLPFGFSDDGVPIGVMLTGRQAGEPALLSVAAQLEAARSGPFAVAGGRRPDCW